LPCKSIIAIHLQKLKLQTKSNLLHLTVQIWKFSNGIKYIHYGIFVNFNRGSLCKIFKKFVQYRIHSYFQRICVKRSDFNITDFVLDDWKRDRGFTSMEEHSIARLEEELGMFGYLHKPADICNRTAGIFTSPATGWTNSKPPLSPHTKKTKQNKKWFRLVSQALFEFDYAVFLKLTKWRKMWKRGLGCVLSKAKWFWIISVWKKYWMT
jgi:hypothetical protein